MAPDDHTVYFGFANISEYRLKCGDFLREYRRVQQPD